MPQEDGGGDHRAENPRVQKYVHTESEPQERDNVTYKGIDGASDADVNEAYSKPAQEAFTGVVMEQKRRARRRKEAKMREQRDGTREQVRKGTRGFGDLHRIKKKKKKGDSSSFSMESIAGYAPYAVFAAGMGFLAYAALRR